MTEMRGAFRYPVRAPAFFTWSDLKSRVRRGKGLTRDISSRGLYVWSEESPPAGVVVDLEVLLPSFNEEAPGLRIEGRGHVIRTDSRLENTPQIGFGLSSENFILWGLDEQPLTDEQKE